MGEKSNIQWTDATWNIAVGCTKVDEDCKYCYMYRDSMDGKRFDPKIVRKTKTVFNMPLKYKNKISKCWDGRPLIFTSSYTDWGHELCDEYRHEMWNIIKQRKDLIFQCLTKRISRGQMLLPEDWGRIGYSNVWLGTSIGSDKSIHRLTELNELAGTRFVSFEPLWGRIDCSKLDELDTCGLSWVIIGGESGNDTGRYGYRPCELEWIEELVNHFKQHGVPVFVKQMGTHLSKKLKMSDRHGGDINEFPVHLQLREFPKIN